MAKNAIMGTKNISFPDELDQYIEAKVASGEYAHSSEVVRDAVRRMMEEEAEKLEWLRREVGEAIASVDRGDGMTEEEADADLERYIRQYEDALAVGTRLPKP
jgi:antitoxin ParD1/3/4